MILKWYGLNNYLTESINMADSRNVQNILTVLPGDILKYILFKLIFSNENDFREHDILRFACVSKKAKLIASDNRIWFEI